MGKHRVWNPVVSSVRPLVRLNKSLSPGIVRFPDEKRRVRVAKTGRLVHIRTANKDLQILRCVADILGMDGGQVRMAAEVQNRAHSFQFVLQILPLFQT